MYFDHRVDLLEKSAVQEHWQVFCVIELDFICIYLRGCSCQGGLYRLGDRWRSHSLRALADLFIFLIVLESFSSSESIFAKHFLV